MKRLTIMFIIFPLLIFSQQLSEVVNTALEHSNQVQAAGLLTEAAEKDRVSKEKANLPVISVKANYIHNTDVPEFDIPLPGFNQSLSLNPRDNYEAGIHLDYVVFSGFAQSQAEKVKAFEHSIALLAENKQVKEIAFKTIQAYRNAQFMQLSLEILDDTRQRNQLQLNKAKALLENGMALRLDTLSLSLNATAIEQQVIESQSVLSNWFQILLMLTGKKIEVVTADLSGEPGFNSFSSDEQYELRNIQLQEEKAAAFSGIARAGYYPKIWLNASFNYGRPGPDIINNEWNTYGRWMVGMQWDIWNWGSTDLSVQARDLNRQALQFSRKDLEDKLKLNYDKALRSYETLQKQKVVSEKSLKVAREKMSIVAAGAEKGQLSGSDYNEANLELSQAEIRQKQILVQLNLQAAEIDYLSGKPVKMWRL